MNEIIILTVGDIHISDVNPRSRKDNFKETILGKLDQIRSIAGDLKADAVLLTGDLFNIKIPIKNSHDLNRELIETFKRFKCPVYAIPGNHDLTADDLDTLPEQPISVLFASGALKNLNHEIINKKGFKVSLVGIPFTKKLDLETLKIPPKEDVAAQVCLMHIYASPQGGKLFKERLYGYDELSVLSPDIFVLGHYHEDQGVQWLDNRCFINLGSISRGTLTEEHLDHKPKIGFIKITGDEKVIITADSILLDIKPAEEVFDIKKRNDEKKEGLDIQKFVEHLITEATAADTKKLTVEDHLKTMTLEKEVSDMVLELIQEASTNKK
jgi:Icc-related predicted phosphoesterase